MSERTLRVAQRAVLASILCASPLLAGAADVALVGIFPGKAVLVIDGGAPRTLGVGQSVGGVRVDNVERDVVTVDIAGKKSRLEIGVPVSVSSGQAGSSGQTVTLVADARGHFVTSGSVNGASTTFLVDTGASMITLGPAAASAAGIDYRHGEQAWVGTANGNVPAWRVRLDKVTLGDVTVLNVEGMVVQTDMPYALLGMSFLNRMDMRRDGSTMTLKRRY